MTQRSASFAFPRRVGIVGCGYLGSAFGAAAAQRGSYVRGSTTTPARQRELSDAGIVPVVLTVDQPSPLREFVAGCDSLVITFGAGGSVHSYRSVYADGARNVAGAIASSSVRQVIYTSSTRVYAERGGQWVDEDSDTTPTDDDTAALIEAENSFLKLAEVNGRVVTVLRLAGIHGPARELRTRILRAAGTTRSDGEAYTNLIHRDDAVAAIVRLLEAARGGIFNLTDGRPSIRQQLYDAILSNENAAPITWQTSRDGNLGKRVSNDRICNLFDLSFGSPLDELA